MSSTDRKLKNLDDSTDKRFTNLDGEMSSTERKLKSLDDSTDTRITALDGEMSSTEKRLETLELFLGGLTQWPEGFYALLQPKTGCPVDLAFFGGTHKFHKIHTEGDDSHSSAFAGFIDFISNSEHFVNMEFCEVTRQFNTKRWPEGSFCVHKLLHQNCPEGFTEGYVGVDTQDEDFAGGARNNVADTVQNPYLYFCCQDSGSAGDPIQLPTSSPFLLYRYGGVCQAVQGMRLSEEFLKFDTENDRITDNMVYGSHPDVDQSGTTIKFNLCYYTK